MNSAHRRLVRTLAALVLLLVLVVALDSFPRTVTLPPLPAFMMQHKRFPAPDESAEETQAALVQYGLMTGNEKLDTELTEQFLCDFLNPLGAGITTDTPDHVMTRGELADLLMQLSGE